MGCYSWKPWHPIELKTAMKSFGNHVQYLPPTTDPDQEDINSRKKVIASDPGVKAAHTVVSCFGDTFVIGKDISTSIKQ
jgi:hypothetical protein